MNYRFVLSQLGLLFLVLSLIMLVMAGGFFVTHLFVDDYLIDRHARTALIVSGVIGLVIGGGLYLFTRKGNHQLGRREATLLVAVSWLVGAAYAALPYYFWAAINPAVPGDHPFASFIDCYFEAMSGLTTTGATVLSEIETMPRSLLLWRSLTQWLGGLGIVVLFVAVLPSLGAGGRKLFRVETSGLSKEGVQPHIRDTARVLWLVYLSLTLAEVLMLRFAGMGWFDSVNHTFTTMATGGFSPRNASIGAYDSALIQGIIILFMVLAGVNFALYFHLIRGRPGYLFRDRELHAYLAVLAIGAALIAVSLLASGKPIVLTTGEEVPATLANAAQHALFQGASILTTTGYATADFNTWPFLAQGVLLLFMFFGGCAASTAGGIKIVRVWVVLKVLLAEIERAFRPNVVRPLRMGRMTIDQDTKLATLAFVLGVIIIFILGSAALMLIESANPNVEIDYRTASSATAATLFVIGPGFGLVGAVENYGWFTAPSKLIMSVLMVIGRLEVFGIIVLFSPRFWRSN